MFRGVRRLVQTEARLAAKGIELPPPGAPKANYNLVSWESPTVMYVSGHLPIKSDGSMITGTLGANGLAVADGQEAARFCALNIVSSLKAELGDLDRVEKVVKLFGIVRSEGSFTEQHLVMNGASDLMAEVFEARGSNHARSAIGTNTLPLGVAVEVEAIVKVKA
jgi:enamine deaminase RidA (YjgF/YER057c/UK114 family)